MLSDRVRDLAGFAFFFFAAVVGAQAALEASSLLAWLYVLHNCLLGFFYLRRRPAKSYDRSGLWLGMIAAFLPNLSMATQAHWYWFIAALAAYGLILWSLVTLGSRFGIAPADRGLTCRGPYRYLRHPMYLGELVFRGVLVISSPNLLMALLLTALLAVVQCWRILREERAIEGYSCYTKVVRWRLVPGIW
jgi:protein-S-isoprenylcysteine O-methyltransferase Ste14